MNIKETLVSYNQEYLLNHYNNLGLISQRKLEKNLKNINFDEIKKLYMKSWLDYKIDTKKISLLKCVTKEEKYFRIGEEVIKNNQYAIITMAGGSGTRLGHNGPKGTYELTINKKKVSIFEILINKLKETNKKYNITLNWYIMTGENNHKETISFFKDKNYFDYPKNKIIFFKQNQLPVVDVGFNIMLKDKTTILTSSNGNGDVFKSLKEQNIINKLKQDKIKWVLITGIDNILVSLVDPYFIGATIYNNYLIASKTILKEKDSKEYVFCKYNNKPYMLPSIIINNNDYKDTNIVNHLINIQELEKYTKIDLEYHRSYKKSNYYDKKYIISEKNNSFKFEKYIFDVFKYSSDMLLYRVDESEFAPIKNKEGNNSPQTAVNLYKKYVSK